MSTTSPTALLRSLAQHLDDLGLAVYVAGDDVYPEGPTALPAVVIGELPPTPVHAVAVVHYSTDSDVDTVVGSPLHRVQLAFRSPADDSTVVGDEADAAFDHLHSMTPGPWPGGVRPQWVLRSITGKADRDNGSWIRADSYDIRLNPGE